MNSNRHRWCPAPNHDYTLHFTNHFWIHLTTFLFPDQNVAFPTPRSTSPERCAHESDCLNDWSRSCLYCLLLQPMYPILWRLPAFSFSDNQTWKLIRVLYPRCRWYEPWVHTFHHGIQLKYSHHNFIWNTYPKKPCSFRFHGCSWDLSLRLARQAVLEKMAWLGPNWTP